MFSQGLPSEMEGCEGGGGSPVKIDYKVERGGDGTGYIYIDVECIGWPYGFPRKPISIMISDGGVYQYILLKCKLFFFVPAWGGLVYEYRWMCATAATRY